MTTPAASSPGTRARRAGIGGSVISGTTFYPTVRRALPGCLRRRLLLRRLRSQLHLVDAGRRRRPAGPEPDRDVRIEAERTRRPQIGPDGALYYVGFDDGKVHRIAVSPSAVATAQPTSGAPPLFVQFDGSDSTDPKGGALTYAWDLDGDGQFDDFTAVSPTWTYNADGLYLARLRVTDRGRFRYRRRPHHRRSTTPRLQRSTRRRRA